MARMVRLTSSPSERPAIRDTPSARAASSRARCEIDLSPGTRKGTPVFSPPFGRPGTVKLLKEPASAEGRFRLLPFERVGRPAGDAEEGGARPPDEGGRVGGSSRRQDPPGASMTREYSREWTSRRPVPTGQQGAANEVGRSCLDEKDDHAPVTLDRVHGLEVVHVHAQLTHEG